MDLWCHLECKCRMLLLRRWMDEEVKHHILISDLKLFTKSYFSDVMLLTPSL